MNDYSEFLAAKLSSDPPTGLTELPDLLGALFDFQRDITQWALRRGRAAIFAGTGLGKSLMELSWAAAVHEATGRDVLILAPLAVAAQVVREGDKFGIRAKQCATQAEVEPGITVTNYQKLDHFDAAHFVGVVLDESSILKALDGKTKTRLIETFRETPFRLAATATPAPNDFMELGNHAEFLGVMNHTEMLSTFFVHDGGETQKWRLKGHAEGDFWRWMGSWSVMLRDPSDLGYDAKAFELPPLHQHQHTIKTENSAPEGMLFAVEAQTLQERLAARRSSVAERVERAAEITPDNDPFVWWCHLNSESKALAKTIPGAVEVRGSDSEAEKERKLAAFVIGDIRVLISKPSICGFGMNFQNCSDTGFVGLNDSFEQVYQSVRRFWRFGQTNPVSVHFVASDMEGAVVDNLRRKEQQAERMAAQMVAHMADITAETLRGTQRRQDEYEPRQTMSLPEWIKRGRSGMSEVIDQQVADRYAVYHADCVDVYDGLPDDSVHYSIFSPPFESLYAYTASARDVGNSGSSEEFWQHYRYLIAEQFRAHMPGRDLSVHCMNLPTSKTKNGYIGIRDFRGEIIRAYEEAGFIYHSEVCIWKDPVTAMQRTKALGLLHKQIRKDAAMCRQGIPDYVVTFRKPGENAEPISNTRETFPIDRWQQYASPIWTDINPSDTLQFRSAREDKDEKHICPLQLEVIRRCIRLWSREGDTVVSPFAGIGSEGYVALQEGRKFLGAELKASYYRQCVENMRAVIRDEHNLFSAEAG